MDNFIERLDKEITEQTRNGREDVYILVEDLNKLGYGIDSNKKGRVYVDVNYLRIAMKRYQFKNSLKVDINKYNANDMTYREFMQEIRKLEQCKDRDEE